MSRPSLGITDYRNLAEKKGLEFIGDAGLSPVSVLSPTTWRCTLTGVILRKSYHAVKNGPVYGSRYAANYPESLKMYLALAERLSILFVYDPNSRDDVFPANTKTPCLWQGANGNRLTSTYNQLAYTPRKYLLDALGVSYDEATNRAVPILEPRANG